MEQKVSIFCCFFFLSLSLLLVFLCFLSNAEYLMFYLYWEVESCLLHPGLHKLCRNILGWISLDKFGDKVWIEVRLKEQIAIFCVLDHKEKQAGNLWASKATEDVQVCCIVTCHTEPWHFEVNCYHMAGPPYPLRWGWAALRLRLALTKVFCHTKEWQMNGSVYKVLTQVALPWWFMCGVPWIYGLSDGLVITFAALFYVPVTAGMNGFLKAEFSNMWTATLQNKKSFKRPISKFFFFPSLKFPSLAANEGQLYFYLRLSCTAQSCFDHHPLACSSFPRDHYVEGKMRGLAPSKKIAAVQQKNVDLWAPFLLSNLYLTHC